VARRQIRLGVASLLTMNARRFISAFPEPRLAAIARARGGQPLSTAPFVAYFSLGRAALYWVFRTLPAVSGPIWLPDYHCGVEVQAALDAGLKVAFYRINDDLSVDEEDLTQRLTRSPGPLLLVHYFGFPQTSVTRIANLCERLGVPLIEDCAHALYSSFAGKQLGEFAPLAVFSLRKSLPIYDGAALVANRAPFPNIEATTAALDPYKRAAKSIAKGMLGDALIERLRRARRETESGIESPAWEAQSASYNRGFSALSRRLAAATDPVHVIQARRRNWLRVNERLAGAGLHRPVHDTLPEGTCPLHYCFWTRDRDALMQHLAAMGLETFRFGARPHPALDLAVFPESRKLRDEIVGFPVHQELDADALERGLAVLEQVTTGRRCA
jgi:dTDP-4-amino-4,6-dideoxygalactose transaminase